MLEALQTVRRPPWKRPAGAAEQDAADAVGIDDVRRLAGDLHRVAQGGRRRRGQPRMVLVLLMLLVEVLQRRRVEQAADADRVSTGYQSANKIRRAIRQTRGLRTNRPHFRQCNSNDGRRKSRAFFFFSFFCLRG